MVEHVEETVAGIDRRVAGKDLSLKGELRLTCTEVLANLYLPRICRNSCACTPTSIFPWCARFSISV